MYKVLPKVSDKEAFKKYKEAKWKVNKVVSKAQTMYLDEIYSKFATKEGENDIYKLARIRERKCRNLNQLDMLRTRMIRF